MSKPLVVVIAGPTAVGKTALSIELAKHYNTEIISCDSRQLFNELGIAVAKPNKQELQTVKHHFIDHTSIFEEYNAGIYEKEVNSLIDNLHKEHQVLFMVGGTGMYIKAALEGLDDLPAASPQLRQRIDHIYQTEGLEGLRSMLQILDPLAKVKDTDNPQRLMRAIEIVKITELPLEDAFFSLKKDRPYNSLKLYVNMDREVLYERINTRVDQMVDAGMEEEARTLYPHKSLNALQTVGYKEWFDYFDGQWSKSEAVEKIKQHSRNYAKRQLTWFRNQGFIEVNNDATSIIERVNHTLKNL